MDFFRNKKFKDSLKTFSNFILFKTFMLVSHGNIISYYDTQKKAWIDHYQFASNNDDSSNLDQTNVDMNRTYAYINKRKVLSVFRFEIENGDNLGIGVLFSDGKIESLKIADDPLDDTTKMVPQPNLSQRIKGKIISVASDREHSRMIYVISQFEGEIHLWGYTQGKLYDLTSNIKNALKPGTQIVPYFSPA